MTLHKHMMVTRRPVCVPASAPAWRGWKRRQKAMSEDPMPLSQLCGVVRDLPSGPHGWMEILIEIYSDQLPHVPVTKPSGHHGPYLRMNGG